MLRTALIVPLALGWLASAALAQAPADGSKKEAGKTVGKQPEASKGKDGATDALTTCLAMWEPATHMSRQQWARACRRVADRLKDTTVK